MDFSAPPTRPIPSTSSLFAGPTVIKPTASTTTPAQLPSQAASTASASSSSNLKRASTEPTDGLNASSSNTMPALRSRSSKAAKGSLANGDQKSSSIHLPSVEAKPPSPPVPIYDPRDDQIKDLQSDLTKLQKCVTCVVCQDLLFEPYSLGCGHVFCYSCLKDWFRQKKTCPECRARIKIQPAPAYLIRGMIDTFVLRAELQSPHDEGQALRKQQTEALKMVEQDKGDTKGLFSGMFNRSQGALPIFDLADGVARCPDCNWEIENRRCPNCQRRFHLSEMPDADSDASDASDYSEDVSEDDVSEEDDSDSSDSHISISGVIMDQAMPDPSDDEEGSDTEYDRDHRLALALQEQFHDEYMRNLGVDTRFFEQQFGADRANAARQAARTHLQTLSSRTFSTSPGRGLRRSSEYDRDSDDESEENTLDEDDSELDDFIVHDTPEHRRRRQGTGQPTLRRDTRRNVATIYDDEEEEEDEEEEDDSIVTGRRSRNHRLGYGRPIIISSDNEDEEEAAGLIAHGYAQLEHDTTGDDEDDDDESLGESDVGQILRPAGPLRASTMPATTATSIGARRGLRDQLIAAEQQRTATPPASRRRRRTVTFSVPEDADGENDSDARDDDGDLDMDRHSRAGSTSLASNSSNRADAGPRGQHSGGNHFQQDTPSVNEDESSDDSLPRQRSGRRRIGTAAASSSNLRRAATAHPNSSNRRVNRPATNVDPHIHRLLRNFSAQRNEQQLEQLGRSIAELDDLDLITGASLPRSASRDLEELNQTIVINSSPAGNPFPGAGNNSRYSASLAGSARESSVLSNISVASPSRPSRELSVLSNESATPVPEVISAPVQQMTASISSVAAEPSAWEMGAVPTPAVTNPGVPAALANLANTTNRPMRQRRSNAALRPDVQRSSTPTTRLNSRTSRTQQQSNTEREELRRRASEYRAGRAQLIAERSGQNAVTVPRSARATSMTSAAISTREESNGRDSATPTPSSQSQLGIDDGPAQRGITRTDTGGSAGRGRRGFQIGTGRNSGPLFVISDDDDHH